MEPDKQLEYNKYLIEINQICNYTIINLEYLNRDAIKTKLFDIKTIIRKAYSLVEPKWEENNN